MAGSPCSSSVQCGDKAFQREQGTNGFRWSRVFVESLVTLRLNVTIHMPTANRRASGNPTTFMNGERESLTPEMPPQVTIGVEVSFDSFAQFMGNHDAIKIDEQIFEPRHPSNIPRVIDLLFYFLRKHVQNIMLLQKSLPIAGKSQLSVAGVVKGCFKPSFCFGHVFRAAMLARNLLPASSRW